MVFFYWLQLGKWYAWRHDVISCWIELSCQPHEACPVGFTKASTFPDHPRISLQMMHARCRRYTLYDVLAILEVSIYCIEDSRKFGDNQSLLGLVSEFSASLTSSLSKGMPHLETDGSYSKVCPTCFLRAREHHFSLFSSSSRRFYLSSCASSVIISCLWF